MTIHTNPDAAHAVYAPSSGHVWASEHGCTASATAIAAMRRVIPEEEREESAEGTAAHDEIERVLGPFANGGEALEMDGDHPAAFGIGLFVSYAKKLRALWPKGQFWIEHRVRLTDQIWGRLDLGHWDAESATVTVEDYKNGFVGVPPDSEQFRIYAAALIKQYNLPAKWIRYAVVQPNDFMPGPRVKQDIESRESLDRFAERVSKIPDEPLSFRFNNNNCRDCPLLGLCEPSKDVLAQFATVVATGTSPTSAQIPLFLALKKPIDHFFEGLTKNGTKKALAGDIPPGMGLFTSVKHRTWKSEQEARAAILSQKGVDALKPPTPAQAEAMGIDIEGLADKPEGGPVLAFASDKRKPWTPRSSEQMFAELVGNK